MFYRLGFIFYNFWYRIKRNERGESGLLYRESRVLVINLLVLNFNFFICKEFRLY